MRSRGNNFIYFPEDKLTKLENLVQFKRMQMFCLKDLKPGSCLFIRQCIVFLWCRYCNKLRKDL